MLNIHKKFTLYAYNIHKICTFAADEGQTISLTTDIMQADYYQIKLARFDQGLTQAELAQKAKLGLTTVIKAERGGSISPRTNKAIRDALGIK